MKNNLIATRELLGGTQDIYRFNRYGASVIQHEYSYGGSNNLYELAVIQFGESDEDWDITYNTPIADDVIGYLTHDEVFELLHKISLLEDHFVNELLSDIELLESENVILKEQLEKEGK